MLPVISEDIAATAFEELWERREILLYNTLYDKIKEQIDDPEFHPFKDDNISGIRKEFKDLYICFYFQIQKKNQFECGVGFWRKAIQKVFESKRQDLEQILRKSKFAIEGFEADIYSDKKEDHDWICKIIDFQEIGRNKVTLPYLIKEIVNALKNLDKEYSELVDK